MSESKNRNKNNPLTDFASTFVSSPDIAKTVDEMGLDELDVKPLDDTFTDDDTNNRKKGK